MQIETDNSLYIFIPRLGILVNSELKDEFDHLLPPKISEEKFIKKLEKELSDEAIEEMIGSLKFITLNITESCSYRCLYCIFSGNYENTRTHSEKRMKLKTAKKAVDYLITLISSKKRKLKINSVNLGAYGGEPLLEIRKIKKIIKYTQKKFREAKISDKFKIDFNITTNGFLLKGKVLDLLVKYNVNVSISLDGPKLEHDKFRVTRNNKGTWDIIMKNLQEIKSKYPGYYEKNIRFLCTLHPLHDYMKIDAFFTDEKNKFNLEKVMVNRLNMDSLKESIKSKILKEAKKQESYLFIKDLANLLDSRIRLSELTEEIQFTGICRPDEWKLFVDTDGGFHFCERVKLNFPIGHVKTGFDFEKIRKIYRAWSDMIIKNRCWECSVWSFCSVCLAYNKNEKEIDIDCSSRKHDISILTEYLNFKEKQDRNKRDTKKITTIKEYINQLETLT